MNYTKVSLDSMSATELKTICDDNSIEYKSSDTKPKLVEAILAKFPPAAARIATGLKFNDYNTPDGVLWEMADGTYSVKLLALYKSKSGNTLLSTSLGLATIKNIVANATAEAVKLLKDGDEFVFSPTDEFKVTIKNKRVVEVAPAPATATA